MRKVCLFNFPPQQHFHGFQIDTFDPLPYFSHRDRWSWSDLLIWGLNGFVKRRALTAGAAGVDRLYRERDQAYMRMICDFVERFKDYDLIVMSTYNFIHPEVLYRGLSKPIKILGFIDDPPSTYLRGIPYLWAFDGAFYISPSYSPDNLFEEALTRWGCRRSYWWPLVPYPFMRPENPSDGFFRDRDIDLLYVGNPSASKVDRLIRLRKHFGNRFKVYGRWPFKGYAGFVRGLFGKAIFPYRVRSLSGDEKRDLYHRTKIGFNMHVSIRPTETGNARTYEIPAHGMMMICDKAAKDAHEKIFAPGSEAVYYESIEEAIELIEYYLVHEEERVCIARRGFERFWRDYAWEDNMQRFLHWALSLRSD